jgi:hypothetical protein
MFRLMFLLVLAAFAVVWVEARWVPDSHLLMLRLRDGAEIRAFAFQKARDLGQDWVRSWTQKSEEERRPAVGASPAEESPAEELSSQDRSALDRLVRERVKP